MKAVVFANVALAALALVGSAPASTYEVGPGKPFSAVGEVPWEALQPGDTVLIHARPEPYREKFVVCRAGTAAAPITVRGVPDANGQLPVLDGDGATTRAKLSYWGDVRSIVKIGGARVPADTMPAHIVIENLDIRSARPPYTFTGADGKKHAYVKNAAAITVEKAEHLIIRHCNLHDCGNGLFVSSNNERASRDILVERNHIFDNGIEKSGQEHNVYAAAIGITFQHNWLGPLRAGCLGNNLKDRSAGLVVRYNWIEGGNKELDLVDAQDSKLIRADPRYRESFVYGNVFLKLPADGHSFLVHYGGDGDQPAQFRKGTLFFYHNTVIYQRRGPGILFRLSSNDERCDFRNNIVYSIAAGKQLSLVENKGTIGLSHNWFKPGWNFFSSARAAGSAQDDGTSLIGAAPGFVDFAARDFHLTATSPCRDAGNALAGEPFRSHPVERQYVRHQASEARLDDGLPDLGAFELNSRPERP